MSDFLKKLKESVESGKPNESIKAGFDEILSKADKIAADPSALQSAQEKIEKANEQQGITLHKTLTPEEIAALNKLAQEQQDQMFEMEKKALITSGVIAFNCEIETIEQEIENRKKLIIEYQERSKFLQGDATYKEKKALIDKSLNEFNKRGKNG